MDYIDLYIIKQTFIQENTFTPSYQKLSINIWYNVWKKLSWFQQVKKFSDELENQNDLH